MNHKINDKNNLKAKLLSAFDCLINPTPFVEWAITSLPYWSLFVFIFGYSLYKQTQ
jgi:hypothetical protein